MQNEPLPGTATLLLHIWVILALAAMCSDLQSQQTQVSANETTTIPPSRENYLKLAEEMETTLRRDVLKVWFPAAVDKELGGFHSNFTRNWQRSTSEGKFSVFQGRMVWVASQIVMRRPDLRDQDTREEVSTVTR